MSDFALPSHLGTFTFTPLRMPEDLPLLHAWVSQPSAHYWGLSGTRLDEVAEAYRQILLNTEVYLGRLDGVPQLLLERYHPGQHPIGAHYDVRASDRGMHILVAPCEQRVHGFTWACFRAAMSFVFHDPAVERVVVEPDIRNARIHALNRRAGFRYQRPVALPGKTGHLAFCTRADFAAALTQTVRTPGADTAHLEPEAWAHVTRALVRKAIAEFSHELLLTPVSTGPNQYTVTADHPDTVYAFRARRLALDHWEIEPDSLVKRQHGRDVALDALSFFVEFREQLRIPAQVLPVYLEEIGATLYAAAHKRTHERLTSADLVHASFQEIEAAMIEGHPAFVANSGRIGFDRDDYVKYAPEVAPRVALVWLAARRTTSEFHAIGGLDEETLLHEELGEARLADFRAQLERLGLDPEAYHFMPVHPWQWANKLPFVFAGDLATRTLVYLGPSDDAYQPQQSIRTLFNVSAPHRRYVKMALSVLNMGFMRGLSAAYMRDTPAINAYLDELVRGDPLFGRKGFRLLCEVASVGYRNLLLESATPATSPTRKMLAALWRESPVASLAPRERAMTMAALLHRDQAGVALLPQLVAASGLTPGAWLARYLDVYLTPLLHLFYRYDLAFMPHGENVILVLEDHAPRRTYLKDLAEEVALMDAHAEVPDNVKRIRVEVPDALKPLCLFTDVFDGFLRFLAPIAAELPGFDEARFWRTVAACVRVYQDEHPELAPRFAQFDPFVPSFPRSCLNRLQLTCNTQMVDLTNPTGALQFAGSLDNPIAPYAHPAVV